MTTIDGLFEQIIHSEQAAQKRKSYLQELKQNVHSSQEQVKTLQTECLELHQKLSQKLCNLSEKEQQSKWRTCQQTIYQQQKIELQKQKDELVNKEESVKRRLTAAKTSLCLELSNFSCNYSYQGSGGQEREDKYKTELLQVTKVKDMLQKSVQSYSDRQEEVDKLSGLKHDLQAQLNKIKTENRKITSSLCEELEKTAELEKNRLSITNKPHVDAEFISLQCEVDREKSLASHLEEECCHVQAQLQQLQHTLWQQQVKQRQQHRDQHHRDQQYRGQQINSNQHHQQPKQGQSHLNATKEPMKNCDVEELSNEAMSELFSDDDEFTGDTGTLAAAGDSQTTLGDIQTQVQHQETASGPQQTHAFTQVQNPETTSGHQQTQAITPTCSTVSTVTNQRMSQTSTDPQPSPGTTARERKSLFKHKKPRTDM